MTLCIAWKQNTKICFASDSRLTIRQGIDYVTTSDSAPKIFSIPVRIYEAGTQHNLLYDKDWGFCLAGGYVSASGYSDTLSELLSNLQIVPSISIIDYEKIINIAYKIYLQISNELIQQRQYGALCKILITGICPSSNKKFIYEFGYTSKNYTDVQFYMKEIDIDKELIVYLGDKAAINSFNQKICTWPPKLNHLKCLKDICNDSDIPTVGGRLQYGVLDISHPKHFSIFGILESELEFDGMFWSIKDNFLFRSINLPPQLFEGDIHVQKTYVTPFDVERNLLFDEAEIKNEEEQKLRLKKKNEV